MGIDKILLIPMPLFIDSAYLPDSLSFLITCVVLHKFPDSKQYLYSISFIYIFWTKKYIWQSCVTTNVAYFFRESYI